MSKTLASLFVSTAIGIVPATDHNRYYLPSRPPEIVHDTNEEEKPPRSKHRVRDFVFLWGRGAFCHG